jgi:hypothetical protein
MSVTQIGGAHILEREKKLEIYWTVADDRLEAIRLPATSLYTLSSHCYRKSQTHSACPVCSSAPSYTKVLTCSMLLVKIGADWAIAGVRPHTPHARREQMLEVGDGRGP